MRVDGNAGARPNKSPPKPHPMSAISTSLLLVFGFPELASFPALSVSSTSLVHSGNIEAQFISSGHVGLLIKLVNIHDLVAHDERTYYSKLLSAKGFTCARCLKNFFCGSEAAFASSLRLFLYSSRFCFFLGGPLDISRATLKNFRIYMGMLGCGIRLEEIKPY